MQSHTIMIRAGAVAFVLLAPLTAQAVPAPAGLAGGQGYRLAFLTTGTIAATSSTISTYNGFVNSQAAQNSALNGLSWSAIVSTTTVAAVDNAACPGCNDVPVFLVSGAELAASTTALFSQSLMTTFNVDQFGTLNSSDYAWTGSTAAGGKKDGATLGTDIPSAGYPHRKDSGWIDPGDRDGAGVTFPLYALSSEAFVPSDVAAVPEPATLALLGTVAIIAGGGRRRTRRTTA